MSDKVLREGNVYSEFKELSVEKKQCGNCGYIDSGVFCSHCGCSLYKQEISVASLIASVVDFFSDIEDKFLSTFIALLKHPITFVENYIDGKREEYYIPFKYFFLNLSLCVFVYNYFDLGQLSISMMEEEADQLLKLESEVMFDNIIDDYGQFLSLMMIPLYAIICKVLFPKSKYNIAEVSTAFTFLLGQLMLLEVLLHLVTAAFHDFYPIGKYIVLIAEISIVYTMCFRFFKSDVFTSIWKSVIIIIFLFIGMQLVLNGTHSLINLICGE